MMMAMSGGHINTKELQQKHWTNYFDNVTKNVHVSKKEIYD